ncbi:hypothetical protein ACMFMG_001463 [Clarireedia jacksonii]
MLGYIRNTSVRVLAILLVAVVFSNRHITINATTLPDPASYESQTCTDPIIRKEWRELSTSDKKNYIAAVQCMFTLPPKSSKSLVPGAGCRYDDFIAAHSIHMKSIHFVGQFLPYHRYFVASYEKALREECGYSGAQPYWDWTLDVKTTADFAKSAIFDTTLGFGGNGPWIPYNASDPNQPSAPLGEVPGRTGGGCVSDGPFKNITLRLGPGSDLSGSAGPVCLRRDFSPLIGTKSLDEAHIKHTLNQTDYGWFTYVLDGAERTVTPPNLQSTSIHTGGHWSIGGSFGHITDLYVSPSDPLFFLHHTNLDRVFWSWQTRRLPYRYTDISGPLVYADYDNEVAGNTTLAYVLDVGTTNKNSTVGAVMNIRGGTLCYDYDNLL